MPDPIWIDTNVAIQASSGNKAYEAELIRLRNAGHRLLLPPRSFHEFMYGNQLTEGFKKKKGQAVPTWMQRPSPATRAARQTWLSNMRIYVDQLPETPNLAQRIANMEGAGGANNASPSDAIVLGQVRTGAALKNVSNPVLLTVDDGALQTAQEYGIAARRPVPPSAAPPSPAPGTAVSVPAAKAGGAAGPTPNPGGSAAGARSKAEWDRSDSEAGEPQRCGAWANPEEYAAGWCARHSLSRSAGGGSEDCGWIRGLHAAHADCHVAKEPVG